MKRTLFLFAACVVLIHIVIQFGGRFYSLFKISTSPALQHQSLPELKQPPGVAVLAEGRGSETASIVLPPRLGMGTYQPGQAYYSCRCVSYRCIMFFRT